MTKDQKLDTILGLMCATLSCAMWVTLFVLTAPPWAWTAFR